MPRDSVFAASLTLPSADSGEMSRLLRSIDAARASGGTSSALRNSSTLPNLGTHDPAVSAAPVRSSAIMRSGLVDSDGPNDRRGSYKRRRGACVRTLLFDLDIGSLDDPRPLGDLCLDEVGEFQRCAFHDFNALCS